MQPTLEGVRLKLNRAAEQLAGLNALVWAFRASRSVVGEFDAERSQYVYRVTGDPPDLSWGIIVGEFAHNLRLALDNLLWQIILARLGTPPENTSQFPIYEGKRTHRRESSERAVRRVTAGVSADDLTFIEGAQPYQVGLKAQREGLAMLQYLNNVDKHRFVHPASAVLAVRDGERPAAFGSSREYRLAILSCGYVEPKFMFVHTDCVDPSAEPIEVIPRGDDRTEIMRIPIIPTGPNPKVDMYPGLPFSVSLSDFDRPFLVTDLAWMHQCVGFVVDHFAGVLGL
jgi:hypothetical protein